MILQALIAYAERENLGGDPDFEKVGVRWLIPLDDSGNLISGPIALAENSNDKKPKPKEMIRPFTSANELNQGDKSHFLCDTLERAVLFLDQKALEKEAARRKQHEYFKSMLEEAKSACPDMEAKLTAVLKFLNDEKSLARLHEQLGAEKAKPSDNATFSVGGMNLLESESESLKSFWRNHRRKVAAGKMRTRRICLATGELTETLDTTEKIKGVPGGLATGTNLVSFDKDSFCSYGLEQAQNAALSAPAELKIRSALNALIEKSRNQNLVFQNTICLHWTRQPVEFDPVDTLATANPEQVERLLKSVQTGRQVVDLDANAYYALSLSGNGGRIVVRDWFESTVPKVQQHIAHWFIDLGIVNYDDGKSIKREFSLGELLRALENKKLKNSFDALPHGAPEELLHAALSGGPVPQNILMAALRRETIDRVSGGNESGQRKPFLPARFALIKLCLLRSPNRKENQTMTEKLDPNSKDVAYLCGQLFAVLGRLQLLALGKVGASIAERTYGGVATRPATTLGPLFTKVPAYLKKANERFPGAGTNKQKEIEQICQRIEAQGGLPQTLGLEEQGRFALGYYCQLAAYRARHEEEELEKKAEELSE